MNKTDKIYYRVIVTKGDFYNEITRWPDCYGPYDVFESIDELDDFMARYAWGMGISVYDVEEVTFKPEEIQFINVLSLANCDEYVDEMCPNCESEVTLKSVFSVQICPVCGDLILPCNMCNHDTCDCANCPLEAIKQEMLLKYTKNE